MGQRGAITALYSDREKSGRRWRCILILGCICTLPVPVCAGGYTGGLSDPADDGRAPDYTQRNLYGEIGLIDMPSARMAEDASLAFTFSNIKENQRYNLTFQALPWLETAFRFSALDAHYYDRSFSFKARLWQEGSVRPALALGVRDILGTGVYGGEYLVLSKHIGSFDMSGGIGWGRFADRDGFYNPLRVISSSFKKRKGLTSGSTGRVTFNRYFHGPAGLFGGISWQTPVEGLRLNIEYSGDEYEFEQTQDVSHQVHTRSPVNAGLSYDPFDNVTLSANWMYGNTYGVSLTLHSSVASEVPDAARIGPRLPQPEIRSPTEQSDALRGAVDAYRTLISSTGTDADRDAALHTAGARSPAALQADADMQRREVTPHGAAARRRTPPSVSGITMDDTAIHLDPAAEKKLRAGFAQQNLIFYAITLGPADAWVWYENGQYRDEDEAIGRITRLMMADLPPNVEYFHIIAVSHGRPMREVTVPRSAMERMAGQQISPDEVAESVDVSAPAYDAPALDAALSKTMPALSLSLSPKMAQHVFDPDDPLQFMFYMRGSGTLDIAPGWTVNTVLTANLWDDYNYDRGAGSDLHHVRTDLMKYAHDGKYGISALTLEYRARLGANLYALARVGYLEDMYAGFGAQVLWRPENGRYAIGADLYQVWKRDFDRSMGFRSYDTLTGHVTLYTHLPWYHLNFNIHAGRYLARDYGATFELSRRFNTGVEIGAFATFTNVPFKKFGEGSFDKGLILRIPMQWALPVFSQSGYDLYMSSLTRDGGQRLAGDDSLYEETRRTSYEEIRQHFQEIP